MATSESRKPRVFIDADVLFAGSASPTEHGASLTILRMSEITLIDAITSTQVIIEAERNLTAKLPATLTTFRLLVHRCLRVVPAPDAAELAQYKGLADPKDLPILVSAIQQGCAWLVTLNGRHFRPGYPSVLVMTPGELVQRVRYLLSDLNP